MTQLLAVGRSVVVDNTSPSPAYRAALVSIGHAYGARVRAVYLDTPFPSLRGPQRRPGRPRAGTSGRDAGDPAPPGAPTAAKGFDQVNVVRT